ncbi:hypothetical protein Cob_v010425 [Colletotrichum orbiculare MAFF 240422]|uniref:Uncharacterized protein n=1 Tax=Colletotrichum orbiculare (strain 104-T / ATCC 96160 / CBS 514.97 / LARS 414 / MAFF 240422) TaxID=1213857 RepID=N4V7H8_COLOR|nr:hypothetical protein Cob_v010425 [Colletotrichum orbiculare MAFF 240422]
MFPDAKLILFSALLWTASALDQQPHSPPGSFSLRRAAPNGIQPCPPSACDAGERACRNSCRRELRRRKTYAPGPSSHPPDGHWYGPENYNDNVDDFFRGEAAKLSDAGFGPGLVNTIFEVYDSKLVTFGDEPKSLAMIGFHGCMGIVLMSNSGVWMAHITENPLLKLDIDVFENRFIPDIEVPWSDEDGSYGLSDLVGIFSPEKEPVALIFAPDVSEEGNVYTAQVEKLHEAIKRVIGVDSETVWYSPYLEEKSVLGRYDFGCRRVQGKVLAQYQPGDAGSDSAAKARIWIEAKQWNSKTWPALASQQRRPANRETVAQPDSPQQPASVVREPLPTPT